MKNKFKQNSGFSLIELLIAIGLLAVFITMSIIFSQNVNRSSEINRTTSTRDTLLAKIRNVSGMPSALRNSIKAAVAGTTIPINKDLSNCVAGTITNSCKNNQSYPLVLFSPTVSLDSSGNPIGLLPITSYKDSPNPSYFNSFGSPCVKGTPDCMFIVYTSFTPKCPPPVLPATPPPTSDPSYLTYLTPMDICTIAEVVTVQYTIDLDPDILAAQPTLARFNHVTGSIATSVKLIFGNDPQ
ncbi:MAG: PulJ/GspJ family protein [Bdellovibrio sp.]